MTSIITVAAGLLTIFIIAVGMVLWGIVQIIAKRRGWW